MYRVKTVSKKTGTATVYVAQKGQTGRAAAFCLLVALKQSSAPPSPNRVRSASRVCTERSPDDKGLAGPKAVWEQRGVGYSKALTAS